MFDYWERDIIPRRNSFRNFFDEMDREFAQAEEMINRVFNTARGIGPSNVDAFRKVSTFPYYYGYQITVGPDGRPHVREFGNVKPSHSKDRFSGIGIDKPEITAEREPLADVNSTDNEVRVVFEMPGLSKQDIKINAFDETVEVIASNNQRKYHKTLELPKEADIETARSTYNNGILEVTFDKKKSVKPKGKEIKID